VVVWAEAEAVRKRLAARCRKRRAIRVILVLLRSAGLDLLCLPTGTLSPTVDCSGFGEGIFERRALRSEHFAAVGGDNPVVFETDAELTGDVDARLVGEGHAGSEWRGVASDEIGPLVAVHADAVAEAVGEVLVVRTVACVGDDFAGCIVDGVTGDAGTRCG